MNFFKKANIFTILLAFFFFAAAFRLVDIREISTSGAVFNDGIAVAESTPAPQEFSKVKEEPSAEKPAEAGAPKEGLPADKTEPAADAAASQPVPPPVYGEHAYSAAEVDVLQSLSKRRDELDLREQQIEKRAALLKATEGEVEKKITELDKVKSELMTLLNKQKTIEDERINSLVKIYEGMKPKEAARIFDTLDMGILLSVMGKMSERKSSMIIANMNPEKARILTTHLAEQNKLPEQAPVKESTPPAAAAPPAAPQPPALKKMP